MGHKWKQVRRSIKNVRGDRQRSGGRKWRKSKRGRGRDRLKEKMTMRKNYFWNVPFLKV